MAFTALLELTLRAEKVEEALGVVYDTLDATKAFPGCVSTEVLLDVEDGTHVVVLERWDSAESDAAYRAWRRTPEGASALGSVLAAPARLTKYTTADD
jgi:heme oxygenase (mycobilin-producing)